MNLTRRDLLTRTGAFVGMTLIPLGKNGWAFSAGEATGPRKRLIVLMQRGAVDGLNMVIPFTERAYHDRRPTIALAEPGRPGGALDLDGRFGLHPALIALQPLWAAGRLAFVHACGSPDGTRSHFDAQDYMESGTPGVKATTDGWMNRLLAALPSAEENPVKAIGIGPVLPRILRGKEEATALSLGGNAAQPAAVDRPRVLEAFDPLYAGEDALGRAYREGLKAREQLMAHLREENKMADAGAPVPTGFPRTAQKVAGLIRRDPAIQMVFLDLGGWDTHVNQGGAEGQLAGHLRPLGEGLAALAEGLGDALKDTVVLVMSEFGRTAAENGNGGTDHGHGNVMTLLGGAVRGGRVYGEWPGLEEDDLYQGRDVAVTTDFRHVVAAVLAGHLGLSRAALATVFPGLPWEGRLPAVMPG